MRAGHDPFTITHQRRTLWTWSTDLLDTGSALDAIAEPVADGATARVHPAFADLVTWVEDGVRPAGDDVSDPAAVADPDFGCQFTDQTPGAHLLATPCSEE